MKCGVTSCHGNNDEMWSTSCLIMQHKSYMVEQPPPHSFKSYYHYSKVRKYACLHFQCLGSDIQVAYFNQHNVISQCKCNGKYSIIIIIIIIIRSFTVQELEKEEVTR